MDKIDSTSILEECYEFNNKRCDIDIEVNLKDRNGKIVSLIIENKIKIGSANEDQLCNYCNAILEDERDRDFYILFLTPYSENEKLTNEFENLNFVNKKWMYWNEFDEKTGITCLIQKIIDMESVGAINPINEYIRHTLKAFLQHIKYVIDSREKKQNRVGFDLGEIMEEAEFNLKNGESFLLVKRDSNQIQVFNRKTNEKEVARSIMAKFIDENNIKINHKDLNTRAIGKKLIEYLKE